MAVAAEREKIKDKEALGAFDAAIDQTVLGVAIKIKENRDSVAALLRFQKSEDLTDDVIATIAEDYVKKGEFTVNSQKWKKQDIIHRASVLGKDALPLLNLFPETAEVLGLDAAKQDPENFLPDSEALAKPATHIAAAVEENSGWMNFIWFAIQGFINWVIDFVSDGKIDNGLMQHIHMVGANAVADSAARRVNDDPEALAVIQQQGGLDKFREQVYNGAYDKLENKKSDDKPTILAVIQGTNPKQAIDLKNIPENQTAEASIEIEGIIKGAVKAKVDEFFDAGSENIVGMDKPGKNFEFWDKFAKESKEKASQQAKGIWHSVVAAGTNLVADAFAARDKVASIISGGKDHKAASEMISSAVSEGAMNAIKGIKDEEMREFLADPKNKADEFAEKVIAATKETDAWNRVKTNVEASNLTQDQKDELLKTLEDTLKVKTKKMIDGKAADIKKAEAGADKIIEVKKKLSKFDSINDLKKDNDNALSYDEVRVLDANKDGKLTRSELDALPDKVKADFEKILAQANNKQASSKTKNGEEVLFDFNLKAASTPTTTAAIQLNP